MSEKESNNKPNSNPSKSNEKPAPKEIPNQTKKPTGPNLVVVSEGTLEKNQIKEE